MNSVAITHPTVNGYVFVWASGYFEFLSAEVNAARCSITDGREIDTDHLIIARGREENNRNPQGLNGLIPFAGTRGFEVLRDVGFATTFLLICDKELDPDVHVADTHMTAIWLPTRY